MASTCSQGCPTPTSAYVPPTHHAPSLDALSTFPHKPCKPTTALERKYYNSLHFSNDKIEDWKKHVTTKYTHTASKKQSRAGYSLTRCGGWSMVWCRAATMVSIALARPCAQGWPGMISCSLHNSSNAGDTPAPDYRWVNKIDKWHSFPRTQRQTYPEPQELWAPNPCGPYYPLLIIPTTALCRCPQNWSETGTLLRLCSNIGTFQVDFFFFLNLSASEGIQISTQATEMDSMSEASGIFSLSKLCFPVWSLAHEPCPSSQMMREEISPSLWSQRLIYPVSGNIRSFTEFSLCFFWKDCTTNLSELGEATSPLLNNKKVR